MEHLHYNDNKEMQQNLPQSDGGVTRLSGCRSVLCVC